MIDASEVVEGKEYLADVQCCACKKIPLKLNLYECRRCKSIVCPKCYYQMVKNMNDKFMEDNDDMVANSVFTICPSCNLKLNL